jgi:hypothetical protein
MQMRKMKTFFFVEKQKRDLEQFGLVFPSRDIVPRREKVTHVYNDNENNPLIFLKTRKETETTLVALLIGSKPTKS